MVSRNLRVDLIFRTIDLIFPIIDLFFRRIDLISPLCSSGICRVGVGSKTSQVDVALKLRLARLTDQFFTINTLINI